MQVDPDHPEDVLKQDAADGDPLSGDDAYDMVRYALMSRPLLTESLPVFHRPGSPEYEREQVEEMERVAIEAIKPPEEVWGDMESAWD